MRLRPTPSALVLIALAIGCGDDDVPLEASTSGTPPPGGAGAQGGQPPAGGAGGAGGEPAPAACGADVTAVDLRAGSWDPRFTVAGFTGHDGIAPAVHDLAVEPDGDVVATGRFQWFEGDAIAPLARWNGTTWEPARDVWEIPPPLSGFSAIAIASDGSLALATNDTFGEHLGEIWIDEGSGLVSIGALHGQVRSLAWFDGRLWAAGVFTLDAPAPGVSHLATWDGTGWTAPPGGEVDGPTYELTVDGDELWVGGSFSAVGGVTAASVASFDGETWAAFDFPEAIAIYAITRTASGELYAGGAYGDFSDASGVARWDGAGWQTVGGGLAMYETRGVVTDLVAHGDVVDATGCFNTAGGLPSAPGSAPSDSFARWDGAAWEALDDGSAATLTSWYTPFVCGDEGPTAIWEVPHQRLAFDGDRLYAGGWFAGAGGVQSQAIAAYEGSTWLAQGAPGLGIAGNLDTVVAAGETCELYGVGLFTHVAGDATDGRIVHFTGDGWEVLTDELPFDAYCPTAAVSPAGEIAVGCMMFPTNGPAEGRLLLREGDAMVAVSAPGLPPVNEIAWSADGVLWIVGGDGTGYLAKWDGTALTMVEDGFDGIANQLAVASAEDIVVAGSFTRVGEVDAARVAHYDGSTWSPLAEGLPGQALALAYREGTVYVSSYDEGAGAYLLGRFDGTTWAELATAESGLTPAPEFSFNAIQVIEDGVILSTGTAELDDGSGRGALLYRDGAFAPLAGGVAAMGVYNASVTNDSVWVAGTVAEAGSGATRVPTIGLARYRFAD